MLIGSQEQDRCLQSDEALDSCFASSSVWGRKDHRTIGVCVCGNSSNDIYSNSPIPLVTGVTD